MKSKLMAISVLLLALMVTPAMAKPIGPHKAVGKNPHIMPTAEGVELLLPSGGFHSWTADTEFWYMDFVHGLDASKAKIPNALPLTMAGIMEIMTDHEAALEALNKWGYMSYDVLVEMFIFELMGADPTLTYEEAEAMATEMAAMWPEGLYVRFVNVGK